MWFVYLVRCSDGTLYCGIAKDVVDRVNKHNAGKGAKYTKGRRPVRLLAMSGPLTGQSSAARCEYLTKKVKRREDKIEFVSRIWED
jgi:putative endonuclease